MRALFLILGLVIASAQSRPLIKTRGRYEEPKFFHILDVIEEEVRRQRLRVSKQVPNKVEYCVEGSMVTQFSRFPFLIHLSKKWALDIISHAVNKKCNTTSKNKGILMNMLFCI